MSCVRWLLPPPDPAADAAANTLSREMDVPPFVAGLLARRGLRTPDAAQNFLHPKLNLLSDPFALPNMSAAIDRILRALTNGERIVLYGDYDVDGVTSLTILAGMLEACGADVKCFLPMRVEEGYGLSEAGIARCVQMFQPRVLIAVDCGTTSVREISGLQVAGVDVIVFDHHEPKEILPACAALVNAKLGDTYHYLCSAGLVFKVCHALLKRRPLPGFDLKDSLDLVALGTVADLVPLVEENRILVRRGVVELARTRRPGLRALLEVSAVKSPIRPFTSGSVSGRDSTRRVGWGPRRPRSNCFRRRTRAARGNWPPNWTRKTANGRRSSTARSRKRRRRSRPFSERTEHCGRPPLWLARGGGIRGCWGSWRRG